MRKHWREIVLGFLIPWLVWLSFRSICHGEDLCREQTLLKAVASDVAEIKQDVKSLMRRGRP